MNTFQEHSWPLQQTVSGIEGRVVYRTMTYLPPTEEDWAEAKRQAASKELRARIAKLRRRALKETE